MRLAFLGRGCRDSMMPESLVAARKAMPRCFCFFLFLAYFCSIGKQGKLAEWSIAAVLKTVEVRASGGSNPSLSAKSVLLV